MRFNGLGGTCAVNYYANILNINSEYPGHTGGIITLVITDCQQMGFEVVNLTKWKGQARDRGLLPEDAYGFNSREQRIESPAQGEHPTLISWLKAWALELDWVG